MSSICHTITDKYDARILRDTDSQTSEIFRQTVQDARIGPQTNTTALQLIQNHFSGVKPTPTFVIGPHRLTKLVKDDVTIYAFGEIHSRDVQCDGQHIVEFMQQVVTTTDCFIDLYIEIHSMSLKNVNMTHLGLLRDAFRECVFRDMYESCQLKTARVHYTDIRLDSAPIEQGSEYLRKLMLLWNILQKSMLALIGPNRSEHIRVLQRLLLMIVPLRPSDLVLLCYQLVFALPRIKKELDRSTHRQQILEWFEVQLTEYINSNWNEINQGLESINVFPWKPEKMFLLHLFKLQIYIMDTYTLARVFKVFNVGPEDHQPPQQRNIILYFGDYHTTNYVSFLVKNGFKIIYHHSGDWDGIRCLKLSPEIMPLFGLNRVSQPPNSEP